MTTNQGPAADQGPPADPVAPPLDASATAASLRETVRGLLDLHWVDEGYCAPNSNVYPWQWLWDSCFHSIIWAELGDARALIELDAMFGPQDAAGFVPHMNYAKDPQASADLWRRHGSSSITQPPMYGHTIAALSRRGMAASPETIAKAQQGLRFLVTQRARSASGLLELVHPWESGADDSPRWDDLCAGGWTQKQWRGTKMYLVPMIETNDVGSPIKNPQFPVASIGFNALVAFNIAELEAITGPSDLGPYAAELTEAIAARWNPEISTWVDEGPTENGSGRTHTADAFFATLVDPDPSRAAAAAFLLTDPDSFGGACGPAGVHKAEPMYDPDTYWRGPAWPQMSYLLWLAMMHHGQTPVADAIAQSTVQGALSSGFAEYWHPDSGRGLGAIPQSWTGLALVMSGQ